MIWCLTFEFDCLFCYLWCLLVLFVGNCLIVLKLGYWCFVIFACCFVLDDLLWVFIVYLFGVYDLVDWCGWLVLIISLWLVWFCLLWLWLFLCNSVVIFYLVVLLIVFEFFLAILGRAVLLLHLVCYFGLLLFISAVTVVVTLCLLALVLFVLSWFRLMNLGICY